MPLGRPVKYTEKKLKEIETAMIEYTEKTAVPILAEFAYNYGINRQELYKHNALSDAIKSMMAKKEFQLEKMAMTNKINQTFAIFSLKQLGWSDKQSIEHTVNNEAIEELRKLYE